MFSTRVTLHARLNDLSRHIQINVTISNENNEAFFEVEHIHDDPVASLDHVPVYKFVVIIYVATHEQKAPINILCRSKAPKTQQV